MTTKDKIKLWSVLKPTLITSAVIIGATAPFIGVAISVAVKDEEFNMGFTLDGKEVIRNNSNKKEIFKLNNTKWLYVNVAKDFDISMWTPFDETELDDENIPVNRPKNEEARANLEEALKVYFQTTTLVEALNLLKASSINIRVGYASETSPMYQISYDNKVWTLADKDDLLEELI